MVGPQSCLGDQIIFDHSISNSIASTWSIGAMWQIGAAGALQAGRPAQRAVLSTKLQQKASRTPVTHEINVSFPFQASSILAFFFFFLPETAFGRRTAPSTNKSDSLGSWSQLGQWGEGLLTACTALWFPRWWIKSCDWLRLRCPCSLGRGRHGGDVSPRRGARCRRTGNPNRFHRKLKDAKRDAAQIVSSLPVYPSIYLSIHPSIHLWKHHRWPLARLRVSSLSPVMKRTLKVNTHRLSFSCGSIDKNLENKNKAMQLSCLKL